MIFTIYTVLVIYECFDNLMMFYKTAFCFDFQVVCLRLFQQSTSLKVKMTFYCHSELL